MLGFGRKKIPTKEFSERLVDISFTQRDVFVEIVNSNIGMIKGLKEFKTNDQGIWLLFSLFHNYFSQSPWTGLKKDKELDVICGYSNIHFLYLSLEGAKEDKSKFPSFKDFKYEEFDENFSFLVKDQTNHRLQNSRTMGVGHLHYSFLTYFFSNIYVRTEKETINVWSDKNCIEFMRDCSTKWKESSYQALRNLEKLNERPTLFHIDKSSMEFYRKMKSSIGKKN